MPNNGRPSTEDVVRFFQSQGLHIHHTIISDRDVFAKRGKVRNVQARNAAEYKADYTFFADCDNVYHPDFFHLLQVTLDRMQPMACLSSADKYHTEPVITQDHARLAATNHLLLHAYNRALEIPRVKKVNKHVAAGCMQVIKTELCKGYYVRDRSVRDLHLFDQFQGARSDIQFRRRFGQSIMAVLPHQIHMNHERDKEARRHLEDQR
jgi:predicted RNA-binding protein with PUA-like domain